ncbi:MAG TPA: DUF3467 domain-containing protein [Noviherbaspirillum sp.]|jgi:hypothetical protein|uniref:DUF3467 domain-containing protein n=1 Tax=Noviherbaspirillum sp. TaxID=1926288 RepID=UPI002F924410
MARSSKGKTEAATDNAAAQAAGAPANEQASARAAAPAGLQSTAQPGAAPGKTQLKWDDAQMRTAYANVCNVFGSREEITLLFGTNQVWQPGELQAGEVRVALGERIVLTPYTAKRLALMLEKGLAEYEKRFGKIEL